MPIDRPDGRHWCAPDQETPDEQGVWVCSGCATSWTWVEPTVVVRTNEAEEYQAIKQEYQSLQKQAEAASKEPE